MVLRSLLTNDDTQINKRPENAMTTMTVKQDVTLEQFRRDGFIVVPDLMGAAWVAESVYAYDANGNRLRAPGLIGTPDYDGQDRMLSYNGCSYTYRPTGEVSTKTCGLQVTTYDYDHRGQLLAYY